MKKKIIVAGPIGDFGGRDVEVNIIARALENEYDVKVLSTIYMTEQSFALQNLQHATWNSVPKILVQENKLIKCLSAVSRIFNKGEKQLHGYVNNTLSTKFLNIDRLYLELLFREILKSDLVILCVQLTTKFLPEMVAFCHQNNIPCLLRTTGTIREVPEPDFDFLKKVDLFIHHSEANAENLNRQIALPYKIIDQCALTEAKLLDLDSTKSESLRFGYLGRLSREKGILPAAGFFAETDLPFLIAGDGDQKEPLLRCIQNQSNCIYTGLVGNENIRDFFNQIDVLVIPSLEESGPLVGLEAMAAGKIIISTRVGAMPERLEGIKSFWFEIENVSSLQTVLQEIENTSQIQLSGYASEVRDRYIEKYSFEAIATQYNKTVQQFLS